METDEQIEESQDNNKRERNNSVSNSPNVSPPNKKSSVDVSSLQEEVASLNLNEESVSSLKTEVVQLEKALEKLENEHANVVNKNLIMKLAEDKLKKEISAERKEFKKVKDENAKLNIEISKLQCEKDKGEAEAKAEMKLC